MSEQVKVILWGLPRSLSSIFLKCMSGVPNSKMIFELYSCLNMMGPDRVDGAGTSGVQQPEFSTDTTPEDLRRDPGSGFPCSMCNTKWAKDHLETGYPDKQLVFAKELVPYLYGKYHQLPKYGYRHAFLIRDPAEVMPSWKKLLVDLLKMKGQKVELDQVELDKMPAWLVPKGLGFKEAYDLYQHVKDNGLDSEPVIIDADDLLKDPANVLTKFCEKLGIPYSDSLLTWNECADEIESWTVCQRIKHVIQKSDSFKNFRNSTGFLKPSKQGQCVDFSPDLQRCIDLTMPYYMKMYEQRLK